jgi:DNA-binding transcriptional LysR family regulator
MKLDIDGIQAFVLVAELGGFHKAAERLHLSQTALTRRVQKLERYLGLRLLDRTTRSVSLTAVGRGFLPRATRLVEELTLSVDELKDMSPRIEFLPAAERAGKARGDLRVRGIQRT